MSRQAEQSARTRREIVTAARRLFAEHGYAGTSVSRVATEARVSVQTIYDSVGSKAELVRAMNDLIDEESGIAEIARTIETLEDPPDLVAVPARISRRILERCGDIVRASLGAAASDPELGAVAEVGRERHHRGVQGLVGRLDALEALAVPRDEAFRVLGMLTDTRTALICLDDYGWTLPEWESWAAQSAARLLLRD